MMIKLRYIFLIIALCYSCNSDSANDCFQSAGRMTTTEIVMPSFSKIRVNRDISLVLKEGPNQMIQLETGENLINDIEFNVYDDWLTITNHKICNFVRDYNTITVYVTVPNLVELLCSTQFQISSQGTLNFPTLRITSENFNDQSVIALGEVLLEVNAQQVEVVGNNNTTFTMRGNTDNLNVFFADGNGFFDGRELSANSVNIYHRGTNNITVKPIQELYAELRSTGNVIATHEPPIVHIEAYYTGQVFFE